MTRLAGPTLLLQLLLQLLLVALGGAAAQEDNVTLEVRYPQRSITAAGGSSVKLSCNAIYIVELCGLLRVAWYRIASPNLELTDPGRYFTAVNETGNHVRRRQVVTEILSLTPKDHGQFQCQAQCDTGETSMGHYISITVEG
ncbi:signal-regulatory protein beta-1 [Clinocottus analis]|uniref:signal-regulatory protein beta-1 n=1 Tax=Clinocottus analis TaxID=304258 RepID=UPI0035C11BD1